MRYSISPPPPLPLLPPLATFILLSLVASISQHRIDASALSFRPPPHAAYLNLRGTGILRGSFNDMHVFRASFGPGVLMHVVAANARNLATLAATRRPCVQRRLSVFFSISSFASTSLSPRHVARGPACVASPARTHAPAPGTAARRTSTHVPESLRPAPRCLALRCPHARTHLRRCLHARSPPHLHPRACVSVPAHPHSVSGLSYPPASRTPLLPASALASRTLPPPCPLCSAS
ncbi:hypothetical protein B0H11DRAFT_818991 [Mycena galericulata]|nr:hypothetical protein B0H11DRAFT_818991 [Mycena galericulata]